MSDPTGKRLKEIQEELGSILGTDGLPADMLPSGKATRLVSHNCHLASLSGS